MRTILLFALLAAPILADEDKAARETASALAKRMASKDLEERLNAVREAANLQHALLVSPLVKLLKDKEPRVRSEAIAALGRRDDPKDQKSAAKALAARLKPLEAKEETHEELLAAIQALHDLAQPVSIKPLLDVKSGTERSTVRERAMAVANVPSKEAIERLIQFGYKDRRGSDATRRVAVQALAYATQNKMRGGLEEWRRWWSENKSTFDLLAAAEKRAEQRNAAKEKANKRKNRKKKADS